MQAIIHGIPISVLVDTGASVSIVRRDFFDRYLPRNTTLYPDDSIILDASRRRMDNLGRCYLPVSVGNCDPVPFPLLYFLMLAVKYYLVSILSRP